MFFTVMVTVTPVVARSVPARKCAKGSKPQPNCEQFEFEEEWKPQRYYYKSYSTLNSRFNMLKVLLLTPFPSLSLKLFNIFFKFFYFFNFSIWLEFEIEILMCILGQIWKKKKKNKYLLTWHIISWLSRSSNICYKLFELISFLFLCLINGIQPIL